MEIRSFYQAKVDGLWDPNTFIEADGSIPVYTYYFDGIIGGSIFQELADSETLSEFYQGSEEIAEQIWCDLQLCFEYDH